MPKKIDMTGARYGRLTVIKENGRKHGRVLWLCQCDCGNTITTDGIYLRQGDTKSCGCYQRDIAKLVNSTHRSQKTRVYNSWRGMKDRCYNEKHSSYADYGGRGITVCEEWRNSFESFRDWAYANGYNDDLTIDRIDPNGNYEPSNCRWATKTQQARNTRRCKKIEFNGETHNLSEWAQLIGVSYRTLYHRIFSYHMPIEKALTKEAII